MNSKQITDFFETAVCFCFIKIKKEQENKENTSGKMLLSVSFPYLCQYIIKQKHQMEKQGEIILYQPDEAVKLEVRLEDETVWLNRQQLSELFDRDIKTIGKHISNALKEELIVIPTVAKFATVQKEGERFVTRQVEFYNLDMILSIGYRVKSKRGILFRQWANKVLKDYLLKGYSINQRLNEIEQK